MKNEFGAVGAAEEAAIASNDNRPLTMADVQAATMEIVDGMINWDNLHRYEARNVTPFDWERFGSILNRSLKHAVPDMQVHDDILEDFTMWLPYTRDLTFVRDTLVDITNSHLQSHFLGSEDPLRSVAKSLKLRLNFISKQQLEPITPSSEHHIGLMVVGYDEDLNRKRNKVDVQRAVDAGLKL